MTLSIENLLEEVNEYLEAHFRRDGEEFSPYTGYLHPHRLVCSMETYTKKGKTIRNSFSVAFKDDRWFLWTWSPRFYRLPADSSTKDVSELCSEVLTLGSMVTILPDAMIEKWRLVPIDDRDFFSPSEYARLRFLPPGSRGNE